MQTDPLKRDVAPSIHQIRERFQPIEFCSDHSAPRVLSRDAFYHKLSAACQCALSSVSEA